MAAFAAGLVTPTPDASWNVRRAEITSVDRVKRTWRGGVIGALCFADGSSVRFLFSPGEFRSLAASLAGSPDGH